MAEQAGSTIAEGVGYPGAVAPTARGPSSPTASAWPSTSGATSTPRRSVLAHGGFDFARTFDVFAPHAGAGGLAGRGVGPAGPRRLRARRALLLGGRPARRRGGGRLGIDRTRCRSSGTPRAAAITVQFAAPCPTGSATWSTSTGCRRAAACPTSPTTSAPSCWPASWASWLDFRRSAPRPVRKPGTIDELAERRAPDEPATVPGVAALPGDGRRPGRTRTAGAGRSTRRMRMGGFGPWRPEWAMARLPGLGMPLLAVLGLEPEAWVGAPSPTTSSPTCPPARGSWRSEDTGHFVHIEQPRAGRPTSSSTSSGSGVSRLDATVTVRAQPDRAGPAPRCATGTGRPLLLLHGLGERSPTAVPDHLAAWPGPVWALDFTGHGASSVPRGGGYTAEMLWPTSTPPWPTSARRPLSAGGSARTSRC